MGGLDALVERAALADQEQPSGGPGAASGAPGAAATADEARIAGELAGALQTAARILAPLLPSVAAIYAPEVCADVGAQLAPVCVKRGWLSDGLYSKWGPEIQAAACLVPLAVATYAAALVDVERLRAAQKPAKGGDAKPAAPAGRPGAQPAGWEQAAKKPEGSA